MQLLNIYPSGFELTMPWLTEEGLPQKGLFNVYYFGIDHGKKNKNFQPNVKLRKSMLHLVRSMLVYMHIYIHNDTYRYKHSTYMVGSFE